MARQTPWRDGRGLVIVFSDGADTASFWRPESVLATAKRTDVRAWRGYVAGS